MKALSRIRQISVLLLLFTLTVNGQEKYTLNGTVRDVQSGEDLIGVTIYSPELLKGTTSNSYGFYSLSLPAGKYNIVYSFVGYEKVSEEVELTQDIELNIG
ncbi:MAG: carboxypeptidase-like regulatory domain-containing protein, partial [Marinilabiliaceae bacterium]|nr:carboxypeptidase-like regulatory domain-containing protein [Marinilabiliaceae bacterium]